jgi:nucleoside-diphosphate-sugar epimerase
LPVEAGVSRIASVKKRVLIAGFGYVGGALADALEGHSVFALSRSGTAPAGVTGIAADLSDRDAVRAAFAEPFDWVVYLASPDGGTDEAYERIYVHGLRHVIDAARRSERLILVSSTGVYGASDGSVVDEATPPEPRTPTGRVLLEGERIALESPIRAVVLRPGGIYGPTRTRILDRVRSGAAVTTAEPRFTNRIHRDDCAGAIAHLLALDDPRPIYVGVDDEPADMNEVQKWIARALGVAEPPPGVEGPSERGKRCSNALLRASGYRLRYPTFREGYGAMIGG